MRAALVALGITGCVTAIQPREGTLVKTASDFTAATQLGSFSLGETLKQEHVVLVFYRGHW